MLKKDITYVNFNDEEVTRTAYFNYTKTEIREMEASVDGSLSARLQAVAESKDIGRIYEQMQSLVLKAYGVRSEDGERFIKNEAQTEDFRQSATFDALMEELIQSEDGGASFLIKTLPTSLQAEVLKNSEIRKNLEANDILSAVEKSNEVQYQMPIDQGGPQDAAPTQNPNVDTTPPIQVQVDPTPVQDVRQSTLERELRQGEF